MRLALRFVPLLLSLSPSFAQTGFQEPGELFVSRPATHTDDVGAGAAPAKDRGGEPPSPRGSQPIPEPSSLLLVGTGLVGVALTARWSRWRRRQHGIAD